MNFETILVAFGSDDESPEGTWHGDKDELPEGTWY